jgi:hypothetical protein
MARKKKHPEHINHERWLVSYADFITLLFAFFVVMFAVSQVDSNRVGRFSEAFTRAMGMDIWPMPGSGIFQGMPMINGEPRPRRGRGAGHGLGRRRVPPAGARRHAPLPRRERARRQPRGPPGGAPPRRARAAPPRRDRLRERLGRREARGHRDPQPRGDGDPRARPRRAGGGPHRRPPGARRLALSLQLGAVDLARRGGAARAERGRPGPYAPWPSRATASFAPSRATTPTRADGRTAAWTSC